MPESVKCPKCGTEIGELVEIDNVQVLRMGNALCRAWYGSCARCGEAFSWSLSSIALKKLIERVLQSQKK